MTENGSTISLDNDSTISPDNDSNIFLDNSIKKVFDDFKNKHRNLKTREKWIYKFSLASQLSFYFIPMIAIMYLYKFYNRFIKKEDELTLESYVILNMIVIGALHIYSNTLTPPELQYDYL